MDAEEVMEDSSVKLKGEGVLAVVVQPSCSSEAKEEKQKPDESENGDVASMEGSSSMISTIETRSGALSESGYSNWTNGASGSLSSSDGAAPLFQQQLVGQESRSESRLTVSPSSSTRARKCPQRQATVEAQVNLNLRNGSTNSRDKEKLRFCLQINVEGAVGGREEGASKGGEDRSSARRDISNLKMMEMLELMKEVENISNEEAMRFQQKVAVQMSLSRSSSSRASSMGRRSCRVLDDTSEESRQEGSDEEIAEAPEGFSESTRVGDEPGVGLLQEAASDSDGAAEGLGIFNVNRAGHVKDQNSLAYDHRNPATALLPPSNAAMSPGEGDVSGTRATVTAFPQADDAAADCIKQSQRAGSGRRQLMWRARSNRHGDNADTVRVRSAADMQEEVPGKEGDSGKPNILKRLWQRVLGQPSERDSKRQKRDVVTMLKRGSSKEFIDSPAHSVEHKIHSEIRRKY